MLMNAPGGAETEVRISAESSSKEHFSCVRVVEVTQQIACDVAKSE